MRVWAASRSSESEFRTTHLMALRRRGSTSRSVEFVALSIKALTFPPCSSIFACQSVQREHDILILISKSKSLISGQCALPQRHDDDVGWVFSSSSSSLLVPSIYIRATIEHDGKRIHTAYLIPLPIDRSIQTPLPLFHPHRLNIYLNGLPPILSPPRVGSLPY